MPEKARRTVEAPAHAEARFKRRAQINPEAENSTVMIFVDAADVAGCIPNADKLRTLNSLLDALAVSYPAAHIVSIVDSNFADSVGECYAAFEEKRHVMKAPKGVAASRILLAYANKQVRAGEAVLVVSNSTFRDWHAHYPWLVESRRLLSFTYSAEQQRQWRFHPRIGDLTRPADAGGSGSSRPSQDNAALPTTAGTAQPSIGRSTASKPSRLTVRRDVAVPGRNTGRNTKNARIHADSTTSNLQPQAQQSVPPIKPPPGQSRLSYEDELKAKLEALEAEYHNSHESKALAAYKGSREKRWHDNWMPLIASRHTWFTDAKGFLFFSLLAALGAAWIVDRLLVNIYSGRGYPGILGVYDSEKLEASRKWVPGLGLCLGDGAVPLWMTQYNSALLVGIVLASILVPHQLLKIAPVAVVAAVSTAWCSGIGIIPSMRLAVLYAGTLSAVMTVYVLIRSRGYLSARSAAERHHKLHYEQQIKKIRSSLSYSESLRRRRIGNRFSVAEIPSDRNQLRQDAYEKSHNSSAYVDSNTFEEYEQHANEQGFSLIGDGTINYGNLGDRSPAEVIGDSTRFGGYVSADEISRVMGIQLHEAEAITSSRGYMAKSDFKDLSSTAQDVYRAMHGDPPVW